MNIRRRDDAYGIDIKITFDDDRLTAHRISAPPHEFNDDFQRIAPRVRISPLSIGQASADELEQYAAQLLQIAKVARELQDEINAKWEARAAIAKAVQS